MVKEKFGDIQKSHILQDWFTIIFKAQETCNLIRLPTGQPTNMAVHA